MSINVTCTQRKVLFCDLLYEYSMGSAEGSRTPVVFGNWDKIGCENVSHSARQFIKTLTEGCFVLMNLIY